jgi:hypothetical protein
VMVEVSGLAALRKRLEGAVDPATPWLWPIFRARLPSIKDRLRKLAGVAFETKQGGV